jgi:hypothetical protein
VQLKKEDMELRLTRKVDFGKENWGNEEPYPKNFSTERRNHLRRFGLEGASKCGRYFERDAGRRNRPANQCQTLGENRSAKEHMGQSLRK